MRAPRLTGAKITKGKVIGRGQRLFVRPVKEVLIDGEHTAAKRPPRLIERVRRKFIKSGYDTAKMPNALKTAILAQEVWRDFQKANLPVPSYSKIDLRSTSPTFMTRFMENLKIKYGPLIDGHKHGAPKKEVFERVRKDPELVKKLAQDFATIHNLGYTSELLDFWHFYEKNGKLNRVIIDFESFERIIPTGDVNHPLEEFQAVCAQDNISMLSKALGEKAELFGKIVIENIRDPALKTFFTNKFIWSRIDNRRIRLNLK